MESVVIVPSYHCVGVLRSREMEFVENTVVLEDIAQLRFQGLLDCDRGNGLVIFGDIPDFDRQIVPAYDVATIVDEKKVRVARDHLGEKIGFIFAILDLESEGLALL